MTPDTDKPTRMTPGEAFDWAYWKDRALAADADRDRLAKRVEELEAALEPFADIADLVDSETEGFSDTDEFNLMYFDYLMASYPLSLFRRARALNQEKAG